MKNKHSLKRHIGNYNGDYWHCMDCDCALLINVIIDFGIKKRACLCLRAPVFLKREEI